MNFTIVPNTFIDLAIAEAEKLYKLGEDVTEDDVWLAACQLALPKDETDVAYFLILDCLNALCVKAEYIQCLEYLIDEADYMHDNVLLALQTHGEDIYNSRRGLRRGLLYLGLHIESGLNFMALGMACCNIHIY